MKSGDQKSPNKLSFLLDKEERENDAQPSLDHLEGLGCPQGASVVIDTSDGKLLFEADRRVQNKITNIPDAKMEKYTEEIMLAHIQYIDILEESSSSKYGAKLMKGIFSVLLGPFGGDVGSFIGNSICNQSCLAIEVKPNHQPSYTIILGGKNWEQTMPVHDSICDLFACKEVSVGMSQPDIRAVMGSSYNVTKDSEGDETWTR